MASAAVTATRDERRSGLFALLGAFTIWGLLPLYLRLLPGVPALQITAHRLVFGCLVIVGFLRARGALGEVRAALVVPSVRTRLMISAALVTINWVLFVWSVTSGHVVESSLGYFINPLVNVLLGVLLLGERLRRMAWLAVLLAAAGVGYLGWLAHAPPWLALALALSFSGYGLIRKTVAVDAMPGLAAETLLPLPIGLGYLGFCEWKAVGVFRDFDPLQVALLAGSGVLTALPLWLFAYGARRVRYSTVGVVQYLGPSLQLIGGIAIFHEPFSPARALGFALIWAALGLYAADGLLQPRS